MVHGDVSYSDFFEMSPQAVAFYISKKFPQPEITNDELMEEIRNKAIAEGFNVA